MWNPSFPMYLDTLHPVDILAADIVKNEYTCRLTAFDDGPHVVDVWQKKELYFINNVGVERCQIHVYQRVWVRVRNRRFKRKLIDCGASESGIFVKATIFVIDNINGSVIVQHTNWKGGFVKNRVSLSDIIILEPH
jgi:hypothetical protein